MNKKVMSAMNTQINREFYASYLYLGIATYYENLGLDGFYSWMRGQAEEELEHAMKLYDFIFSRGGSVTLLPIEQPKLDFKGILEPFQAALEHERKVTAWVNEIADIVYEEKDHASRTLIQWFIDEQIEEEKTTADICEKIKMIGDNQALLYMLDKELLERNEN